MRIRVSPSLVVSRPLPLSCSNIKGQFRYLVMDENMGKTPRVI